MTSDFLEDKVSESRGRCNQKASTKSLGSYHRGWLKVAVLRGIWFDLLCWTSMAIFHATFVMSSATLKEPLKIRGCFAIVHIASTVFH